MHPTTAALTTPTPLSRRRRRARHGRPFTAVATALLLALAVAAGIIHLAATAARTPAAVAAPEQVRDGAPMAGPPDTAPAVGLPPSRPGSALPARVAVINYHEVLPEPYSPWVITPERLEEQLRWFLENGWRPLTLARFRDWMDGRLELNGDHFLVTFDDGYRGAYVNGYPVLERLQVPAVYFVITSHLSRDGHWLNAGELAEAAAGGLVSIQSHTHDLHREERVKGRLRPVIGGLDPVTVAADLAISRQLLAESTGERPIALAWPYGEGPRWAVTVAARQFDLLFDGGNRFVRRGDNLHIPRFAMESRDLDNLAATFAPRPDATSLTSPRSRRSTPWP